MFRSYDHLQAEIYFCMLYASQAYSIQKYAVQTLDGNPEPDIVHATGCKQRTLRLLTQVKRTAYRNIFPPEDGHTTETCSGY
jgi:hypothetical protein